jgi:hypothetical protein
MKTAKNIRLTFIASVVVKDTPEQITLGTRHLAQEIPKLSGEQIEKGISMTESSRDAAVETFDESELPAKTKYHLEMERKFTWRDEFALDTNPANWPEEKLRDFLLKNATKTTGDIVVTKVEEVPDG